MMKWTTQLRYLTAVLPLAAVLALPANGAGQHAMARAALSNPDVTQAIALETRATELLQSVDGWDEAIGLLRQASNLRPAGDEVASEDRMLAGRLAFYTGDGLRAIVDLQTAAAQALVCDKPFTAAQAYLDAAWVAVALELPEDSQHFAAQASRLAAYEWMTPAQVQQIHRRLTGD